MRNRQVRSWASYYFWRSESFGWRHSLIDAASISIIGHPYLQEPPSFSIDAPSLSIDCNVDIKRWFISCLFSDCGPSNVSRLVVPLGTREAIKRMTWRRLMAHVFQKRAERVAPSLAHGYSDASIVLIRKPLLVIAALLHCVPSYIFWRLRRLFRPKRI